MAAGVIEYRDGIAILQVIVFAVFLPLGVWFRVSGRLGWFGTTFLSLFRLIGGSCMLATVNNSSPGLWAGVLVCESFGILVLIFLLLEMLERLNIFIKAVGDVVLLVPSLITYACIGVSIAGFVTISKIDDPLAPTPFSRTGIAVTAVIYLYVAGLFVYLGRPRLRALVPADEAGQFACLLVCLPLLGVRLLYALLYIITADKVFNAVVGNATLYLLMTALPEIVILAVCAWTILRLRVLRMDSRGGCCSGVTFLFRSKRRKNHAPAGGNTGYGALDEASHCSDTPLEPAHGSRSRSVQ